MKISGSVRRRSVARNLHKPRAQRFAFSNVFFLSVGTSAHCGLCNVFAFAFISLAVYLFFVMFRKEIPVVMVLCTLKFAHFRLLLVYWWVYLSFCTTTPFRICYTSWTPAFATISVHFLYLFELFVALFSAMFLMFFFLLTSHDLAKETTELETFLRFSEFFLPLLERFFFFIFTKVNRNCT